MSDLPHDLAKLALETIENLPGATGPALAAILQLLDDAGVFDALEAAFRERIEAIDGLTAKVVE